MKYYFVSYALCRFGDSEHSFSNDYFQCDGIFVVNEFEYFLSQKYSLRMVSIISKQEVSQEEYEANL